MNERIEQLALECYQAPEFDYEKFAELIVKECGHLMVDIMLHGRPTPEQGYDLMMEHFGVKDERTD